MAIKVSLRESLSAAFSESKGCGQRNSYHLNIHQYVRISHKNSFRSMMQLAFGNIISDAFKTHTLQIVVMGSGGVGKSAITNRFVNKSFADEWNPTIEDFYTQTVTLEENGVQSRHQVEIIDTAGQVCASFA